MKQESRRAVKRGGSMLRLVDRLVVIQNRLRFRFAQFKLGADFLNL